MLHLCYDVGRVVSAESDQKSRTLGLTNGAFKRVIGPSTVQTDSMNIVKGLRIV